MLDNKNNAQEIRDAYEADKGVGNILGKTGTPIKTRIPTPDPKNPKAGGLDIREEEDAVLKGLNFVAPDVHYKNMTFWHAKTLKIEQRLFTAAQRDAMNKRRGLLKQPKRAWTARQKRMCGCDRNFQSNWKRMADQDTKKKLKQLKRMPLLGNFKKFRGRFGGNGNGNGKVGSKSSIGKFGRGRKKKKKRHEKDTASKKGKIIVKLKPNRDGFVEKRMLLESKQMKPDYYTKNSTSMVCDWVNNVKRSIEKSDPRILASHRQKSMFAPSDRKLKFAQKAERRLFQINKALRDQHHLIGKDDSFEEEQIAVLHK